MSSRREAWWCVAVMAIAAVARAADVPAPASGPVAARGSAPAARPNIVFILADDLGWRDLASTGSTFHQTPHLDRLRARGVWFRQAYAANPLCSPTRASVLTGLWPARIGITAPACHLPQVVLDKGLAKGSPKQRVLVAESLTRLKTDYVTLPELLRETGYATGHFGKWHLGPEPYSPREQGFDVDWPHWSGPGPAGSYVAPWRYPPQLGVTGQPGEHIEDTLSAQVVQFIRAHRDRPFYVNYWTFSVHAPYDAKAELVDKHRRRVDSASPQRNPVYAAMVESLDDAVGRVLDALDECGLAERTLIVFFSDNGGVSWGGKGGAEHKSPRFQADMTAPPTSNLPLRNGKASLYEGGVREPCFVVWPGVVRPGSTSDAVIQSIDWLPTLLEAADVPMPADLKPDGVSLVPALRGEPLAREAIYCHFPHDTPASGQRPGTSVRRGDWKLIRLYADHDDGRDRLELYNLRDDPGETRDQSADRPELAAELNRLIDGFLRETEAVIPRRNPAYRPAATPAPRPAAVGGWTPLAHCTLTLGDEGLTIDCTGRDPHLAAALARPAPAGKYVMELTLAAQTAGKGQLFWQAQGTSPPYHRERSATFDLVHDGRLRTVRVEFESAAPLVGLRLDPGQGPGPIQVRGLRLLDAAGSVVEEWRF